MDSSPFLLCQWCCGQKFSSKQAYVEPPIFWPWYAAAKRLGFRFIIPFLYSLRKNLTHRRLFLCPVPAFLYFGRFCNRWKNSWGPVTGCSRLHQHHPLFRFLFHQWLHRRLWHLPWTELRSQKWNGYAQEYCGFHHFKYRVHRGSDDIVLRFLPSDPVSDENPGRYLWGSLWLYVHCPFRYWCNSLMKCWWNGLWWLEIIGCSLDSPKKHGKRGWDTHNPSLS